MKEGERRGEGRALGWEELLDSIRWILDAGWAMDFYIYLFIKRDVQRHHVL